jgi:putative transcriptional regulator
MTATDRVRHNIVKLRQKRGWTQEHLAFEAEISKAGMCVIESGQRSPTIRTLEKIADALDINMTKLFK